MSDSKTNVPRMRPKAWDKKLRSKFEDVPVNATDESQWYSLRDMAIHCLFKDSDGFQVAPQHMKADYHGQPEYTIFYLIKAGTIPICVVKIKPYRDLKRPQAWVQTYTQVKDRLKILVMDEHPIPTLYGLSVIGKQFLIMTMSTSTGIITLALNRHPDTMTEIAPAIFWRNQVLKRSRYHRLNEMVMNIKQLCKVYPPRIIPGISLVSEEEDSNTSSLSFQDSV
ncbi:hypothetical protein K439DRAFT_1614954 [Ramaria rubella]|nr:hypothetical protein K439DRAFT_1614954 [Ramaria rubella]